MGISRRCRFNADCWKPGINDVPRTNNVRGLVQGDEAIGCVLDRDEARHSEECNVSIQVILDGHER